MFSLANATSPEENKAAGEAFLAENAKKPGIVTTASGLQYQVLTEGTGASPAPTANVTVHYQGTTIDVGKPLPLAQFEAALAERQASVHSA